MLPPPCATYGRCPRHHRHRLRLTSPPPPPPHSPYLPPPAAFRYLLALPEPVRTPLAVAMALLAQVPLAWLTADSWLPDPLLRVYSKNAHK